MSEKNKRVEFGIADLSDDAPFSESERIHREVSPVEATIRATLRIEALRAACVDDLLLPTKTLTERADDLFAWLTQG